eukprot:754632-Hanusia_phi.AAC.5
MKINKLLQTSYRFHLHYGTLYRTHYIHKQHHQHCFPASTRRHKASDCWQNFHGNQVEVETQRTERLAIKRGTPVEHVNVCKPAFEMKTRMLATHHSSFRGSKCNLQVVSWDFPHCSYILVISASGTMVECKRILTNSSLLSGLV